MHKVCMWKRTVHSNGGTDAKSARRGTLEQLLDSCKGQSTRPPKARSCINVHGNSSVVRVADTELGPALGALVEWRMKMLKEWRRG